MHAKNETRLSMNLPGHRIEAWLGTAALKTHALQTLRDDRAFANRAKRLECVRFIGAFLPARDGPPFMLPLHAENDRGLSLNLLVGVPALAGLGRRKAGDCLRSGSLYPANRLTPHASRLT